MAQDNLRLHGANIKGWQEPFEIRGEIVRIPEMSVEMS